MFFLIKSSKYQNYEFLKALSALKSYVKEIAVNKSVLKNKIIKKKEIY